MQEREAKHLQKSNELEKIVIQPSGDNKGWTLKLIAKDGDAHMLRSKRGKGPRVFKTSDACLNCCAHIGASFISVEL